MKPLVQLIVLCIALSAPGASAQTLKETWYLMRGRANMEIGNYAAAVEAYERYLELSPDDREALKGIALAYERQGETDKAIARFDIYLQHYTDDPDIAFKQADYLSWSRYAYRKKDAVRYMRMGLDQRDDRAQRVKYARLLAGDRYDLDEAVVQYERLLRDTPGDETIRSEYRDVLLWDDKYLAKAIAEHERLVERNPQDFRGRRQLAVLLSKAPARLDDSAALYRKLVNEQPKNSELRRDYARVLARIDDSFGEARKQYQTLVAEIPDYELLGEYGALLAKRPETYPDAIVIYERMLESKPADTDIRMKRAAVYLADKEGADEALSDYQTVLQREPRNAAAHRGAAQAYAWLGESDRALYHSNLAVEYGDRKTITATLREQLSKGREPRVSALFESTWQKGGDFELQGVSLGTRASGDPSPFVTAFAEVGKERYDSDSDDANGTWYRVGAQYRVDSQRRLDLALSSRAVRSLGDKAGFFLAYAQDFPLNSSAHSIGVTRLAVADSFLSLVGDSTAGIGGATRDEFFWSYRREWNASSLTLRPAIGRVESAGESTNEFLQIDGLIESPFEWKVPFISGFGYEVVFASYARDHSGFVASGSEPRSGGYFSPQVFLDQYPFARFKHRFSETSEIEGRLGLRVQYVDDAAVSGEFSSGTAASVSYTRKMNATRYLSIKAAHDSVADRYDKTVIQGQIVFIF